MDQNVYHMDEDILNQFRKFFSNNFTTDPEQLLMMFFVQQKTLKKCEGWLQIFLQKTNSLGSIQTEFEKLAWTRRPYISAIQDFHG